MPGAPGYPGGLPQVAADGRTVLFCARDQGCTHVYTVALDGGGAPRLLVGGADRLVSGLSVARLADRAAVVLHSPRSYGEVVLVELAGGETVLTGHSPTDLELFVPQERSFTISDGAVVHGWLLRDPDAPVPGPVLLDVHGGPHNAWSPVADPVHPYHQLLVMPLGLTRTVTLAEEALLHRTAAGHVHEGDEEPRRTPVWGLTRSTGPAGAVCASAGDLLAFARLHLAGGVAADGTRLLSAGAVAAMQACEVALPDPYTLADSWGLGWFRLGWDGVRLVGHDGNTIGQSAFLRVLPEQDLAVTLLTNGGHTRDLYQTVVREVVRELAGVEMTRPLAPPDPVPPVDLTPYQGRYERTGVRIDVWRGEQGPRLRLTVKMPVAGVDQAPKELDLVPVRDGLFAVRLPGVQTWTPVTFYRLADGTPYVHLGARATRMVGS